MPKSRQGRKEVPPSLRDFVFLGRHFPSAEALGYSRSARRLLALPSGLPIPLRLLGGAVLFLEEGVGVLRAFEGRAEIDEVHGRVGDVALEDAEIVAVVEGAHVRVGVADGRALGEGL